MKKILAVFDGSNYSENVLNFINRLNSMQAVSVSGIFLNAYDYTHLWSSPAVQHYVGSLRMYSEGLEVAEREIDTNIIKFEEFCIRQGISFRVHNEAGGDVFETIRQETRFADLLILSNDLFYRNIGEQPNDYMKQVLHHSECAVLVLPEKEHLPDRLILSYDGSSTSVFAIKQFAYILPELCDREAILVSADTGESYIPNHDLMQELAVRHFPRLSMQVLEKDAGGHFANWLQAQKHPLVIAGAFSRSGLSRLFKKSFITEVIKNNNAIVFIAHK